MFRADLAVDRQLKNARQAEGGCDVKAGAAGRQILDGARHFLSGRPKPDDTAPIRG
jgi:hypothetical protein